MQVIADSPDNRAAVDAVLQAATDYHVLVEGAPPTEAHVDEFFHALPAGYTADDFFPLGFYVDGEVVGVGGVLRRWNAPNKAIIGLLVFAPQWRGAGRGLAAVLHIEALARSWPGIDRLRVAVVCTNAVALHFWRKVGFVDTGEIKPQEPLIESLSKRLC